MKALLHLLLIVLAFSTFNSVLAQIATGGQFTLYQSVIATGGGSSTGANLTITGTSGQSVAGQLATQGQRSAHAGFWIPPPSVTTAALVRITGRVMISTGVGVRNVRLTIVGGDGVQRTVLTGAFGYFAFDSLAAGETCVITVSSRRFIFAEPVRVISLVDSISDLNFVALP
jgi:hypothetical protein